jgi:hypothetical protein
MSKIIMQLFMQALLADCFTVKNNIQRRKRASNDALFTSL